ncbi:hypothetical protein N8T08_009735 [Aspergillus melleus]|uniref:Uncharacterized protein n=1 Tax=Aspergillus melleus TaxID=138277 RepID=A0ACC3AU00_9EURO|nr:hypothetical protein N8T08_009735 [Aspergillus melleus]
MTEKFNWDLSGLDKKKFTALANLLAFLFNKIAGEKSLSHESEGYDTDSISIAAYSESYECHSATSHDHGELKIQFLDCLAELVGNVESRPRTCTSMDDKEKGVTIWVTKAGGFKERDLVFLNGLANLLGCLASANGDEKKADNLWTALLGHYAHEFESDFIPHLKCSLEECKETFHASAGPSFSVIREKIETLKKVVFENSDPHLKAMERNNLLVEKAYALREDESVCELLMESADADARTRSLWSIITLLGGTQCIFTTLRWLEDCVISILKRRLDKSSMALDAWIANETSNMDEVCHGSHGMPNPSNMQLQTEQANTTEAFESISLEQEATLAQGHNENPALEGVHHEEPPRECTSCSRLTTPMALKTARL